MNIISLENISKSYSEKILINKVSLGIGEGDKIGLIGVNGTGKSTFLKIVAGVEEPDEGKIIANSKITIGYLPQNPLFDEKATVLEQIFKGSSPVMQALRDYEQASVRLNEDPSNMSLQKQLLEVSAKLDALDAWQLESDAKTILMKLGVSNFNSKVETLSGGQKKRVAMAACLISPADLLILDEPTNHIDNETVEWLEQYLNKRKGALLMITHDRYFLDRIANRTLELDRGNMYSYSGNYSSFLEKKMEREELEQSTERKRQSLMKKELAWIRRGAKARTTKQKARIDRFEKLQEGSVDLTDNKVEISSVYSRLGKKIINIENAFKAYESNCVIDNFSYIVLRDDRIGIVGPNGSGKTTLLNIIAGTLSPDKGQVERGETVKIGYFSQESTGLDEGLRVIDYIKNIAEYLSLSDGTKITASQMLERFLFPSFMQYTPISKLSGGEKRRLYLLSILMGAPNVLILDEPTNDLDIQTLTILEDYIDEFSGAVIVVSHDRYFLDRVADKMFLFEGEGLITQHTGNYADLQEELEIRERLDNSTKVKRDEKSDAVEAAKKDKPLKFTYKEQKEFEQIDEVIALKEEEINSINEEIEKAASDFEALQGFLKKKSKADEELEQLFERWTYLNELAEQINSQKS